MFWQPSQPSQEQPKAATDSVTPAAAPASPSPKPSAGASRPPEAAAPIPAAPTDSVQSSATMTSRRFPSGDAASSIRTRPLPETTAASTVARLSFAPTATATAQATAASPVLHEVVILSLGIGAVTGVAWYFLRDCPTPTSIYLKQAEAFVASVSGGTSKHIATSPHPVYAATYEVARCLWGWYPAVRAVAVALGPITVQSGMSWLTHQLDVTRRLLHRGLSVRWVARSSGPPLSLQERHLRKRMALLIGLNVAISTIGVGATFLAAVALQRTVASVTTETKLGHAVGFYLSQLSQRGKPMTPALDAVLRSEHLRPASKLRSVLWASLPYVPGAYPDVTVAVLLHAWTCWGHFAMLRRRLQGTLRRLRSLLREPLQTSRAKEEDEEGVVSDDDDDTDSLSS